MLNRLLQNLALWPRQGKPLLSGYVHCLYLRVTKITRDSEPPTHLAELQSSTTPTTVENVRGT